jgi:hypothetical protein
MPLSRLELISCYGDQTLSRVRFVVHGTSNATDTISILDGGMQFIEGRPTLSTNLVHARDWTVNPEKQAQSLGGGSVEGEPGSVILLALPSNYHLGYGIFTSAFVDRQLKRVSGAPLRYAAARKQMAFYLSEDTEKTRVHVEAEVANGYPIDQHPRQLLDQRFVVGHIPPGPGLDSVARQLDVSVRAMEPVDFPRVEAEIKDILRLINPDNTAIVPAAIRDIVIGTVESILISRLRMMHWQGLGLLGFKFFEGHNEVQIVPVKDMVEQRRRMDEMGRLLASSGLFTAELAWLKTRVAHELELMRVEFEAAELESLPD